MSLLGTSLTSFPATRTTHGVAVAGDLLSIIELETNSFTKHVSVIECAGFQIFLSGHDQRFKAFLGMCTSVSHGTDGS